MLAHAISSPTSGGTVPSLAGAETLCQITGTLLRYVRDAGGDALALATRYGLSDAAIGADQLRLSVETRACMFEDAAAMLGDPFLGLHMVRAFERGHFGPLEYVMAAAPDVRETHVRLCHFAPLLNPRSRFTWTEHDGRGVLRYHILGTHGSGRHGNELMIAGLFDGLRQRADVELERVWFAHPAPDDIGELVAFLGTSRIEFDASDSGYQLAPGMADRPMASADPRLAAIVRGPAEAALDDRRMPSDLVGEVRAAILACLAEGGSVLDAVAQRLGTAPRTLQRRLADRGVRFHDLLAEVRRAESRRMVAGTDRQLADIARELGYSDLPNFLRAFRRLNGTTPSQVRRGSRPSRASNAGSATGI